MHNPFISGPEAIILDSSELVKTTRKELMNLKMADEINEVEIYNYIFSYLSDSQTSCQTVQNFVEFMMELFNNRFSKEAILQYGQLLLNLAHHLDIMLKEFKVYDPQGVCWYTFDHFLGNDIVLRRLTREEIEN